MEMNLHDLTRYIIKKYPNKSHLSKARLNKLIYLIDWKSSLDYESQISDIHWFFNHYGPYVDDIETRLLFDDRFDIEKTTNYFGGEKNIIKLVNDKNFNKPNKKQKKIIDLVINLTKNMDWNKFINTVYSTYPIKYSERGEYLNLIELAKQYKQQKEDN